MTFNRRCGARPLRPVRYGSYISPQRTSHANVWTQVTGEKPTWTAGDSASLALGDADLIDEDALLDHEAQETRVPSAAARESECGPTKRKACKNCTCGYAETLGAAQAAEQAPPAGGCGSCGLGDAFRCSTCPYLGQPAFKPGDKVKLVL